MVSGNMCNISSPISSNCYQCIIVNIAQDLVVILLILPALRIAMRKELHAGDPNKLDK